MDVPTFDALYVVSDTHMGGEGEFQIFRRGPLLAEFIRHLGENGPGQTALVLNGDVVDFLAEKPFRCLHPEGAIDKLNRIVGDRSFDMVWQELGRFVRTEGRHLIVVVGNHDVELALPNVRHHLAQTLCGTDVAARGRLTLAMDGAGWSCEVGGKRVLCLHGNEDMWNVVDFRQLLDVSRALNRRQDPPEWDANAGTRLVIEVLNDIKKDHPFVDLLKPEIKAVVPILAAVDRRQFHKLDNLMSGAEVLMRGAYDWLRLKMGYLGAQEELARQGRLDPGALRRLLRECRGEDDQTYRDRQIDALLNAAYRRIQEGKEPETQSLEGSLGLLGSSGARDEPLDEDEIETLRRGLQRKLREDQSFNLKHKDSTFKIIDRLVGADVHYIVAGHTHLARAIERRHVGRYYYNSGTWICLIQLTEKQLEPPEEFRDNVYSRLSARSFQELEPLISYQPHVVSITKESSVVRGQLNLVQPDGSLEPVEDSQLPGG
jgi:UDP-2,3-diacylglucosamine pyrophosphatase LpxH